MEIQNINKTNAQGSAIRKESHTHIKKSVWNWCTAVGNFREMSVGYQHNSDEEDS